MGQMGKSRYAIGGGVAVSVHVHMMGKGVKFLPPWCMHTYRMTPYQEYTTDKSRKSLFDLENLTFIYILHL